MIFQRSRLAVACGLAALLSACGGGGGGGALPVYSPSPIVSPSPGSGGTTQSANISFVVQIPAVASSAASMKRPMNFSAATQSVKIAIGTNVLTTANVSSSSSICKAATGGGRSCTIAATAPAGNDQFTITAYDQPNAAGNAIAQATIAATVSSQATTINVTVSGTIVKIALSLSNPYPAVGTSATANVVVTGYDVDGNAVLGAYPSPVKLQDSDATGATSLSATSVTDSTTPVKLQYNGAMPFTSATITATLSGVGTTTATFAPTPAFLKTYAMPQVSFGMGTGGPGPWNITRGPDGNMWIATTGYSELIKVAPDGTLTQYPLPSGSADQLAGIVTGSDGNLWFAESNNNAIGKMTTAGVVTEYTLPSSGGVAIPACVAAGKDGNVWFFDAWNAKIGNITPSGTITEYPLPSNDSISWITTGSDGNLWMADIGNDAVIKVSYAGAVLSSYKLTTHAEPEGIALGPDGNVWVAEFGVNKIGRVTPSGTVTEFSTPSGSSGPFSITAGPDGRMWFAELGAESGFGRIGDITTDGSQVREYFGDGFHVHDLAFDAHGTLWYVALQQLAPWAPQEVGTFAY